MELKSLGQSRDFSVPMERFHPFATLQFSHKEPNGVRSKIYGSKPRL